MNANEVFHRWANGLGQSAKSGNVSFDGPLLYSYRTVIGFMDRSGTSPVAVITRHRYSSTTTRHIGWALRAAAGVETVLPVDEPIHGLRVGARGWQERLAGGVFMVAARRLVDAAGTRPSWKREALIRAAGARVDFVLELAERYPRAKGMAAASRRAMAFGNETGREPIALARSLCPRAVTSAHAEKVDQIRERWAQVAAVGSLRTRHELARSAVATRRVLDATRRQEGKKPLRIRGVPSLRAMRAVVAALAVQVGEEHAAERRAAVDAWWRRTESMRHMLRQLGGVRDWTCQVLAWPAGDPIPDRVRQLHRKAAVAAKLEKLRSTMDTWLPAGARLPTQIASQRQRYEANTVLSWLRDDRGCLQRLALTSPSLGRHPLVRRMDDVLTDEAACVQAIEAWDTGALERIAEKVADWRKGGALAITTPQPLLRLHAGTQTIETSWGASVSVAAAKRLWTTVAPALGDATACQRVNERLARKAVIVDGYPWKQMAPDGTLVIGCHTIAADELLAMARQLGLNKPAAP